MLSRALQLPTASHQIMNDKYGRVLRDTLTHCSGSSPDKQGLSAFPGLGNTNHLNESYDYISTA
jgi:hypothetical protein